MTLQWSHKAVAAGVIATYGLSAATSAAATTVYVTSCGDNDAGSLRQVIAAPTTLSGYTVAFNLPPVCNSKISLTTGAITVSQADLTIHGTNTATYIAITGKYAATKDRIFVHTGTGTLSLNYLDIEGGKTSDSNGGGCVRSGSCTVALSHTYMGFCTATAGRGGAVSAFTASASNSVIEANSASTDGGGVWGFIVNLTDSVVAGNSAANGGGLAALRSGMITGSTLSGNIATGHGGGIYTSDAALTNLYTMKVINSTISGNQAAQGAGIYSKLSLTLQNSTVAFNVDTTGPSAAGLVFDANTISPGAKALDLESTIISNNTWSTTTHTPFDLSISGSTPRLVVSAAHSLVYSTSYALSGTGVTIGACPLLGPLSLNGSRLTQTHAIYSKSPAIDAGSNVLSLPYDQRGAPFQRESPTVEPDIGAYEVQQDDVVFNSGFDGCP